MAKTNKEAIIALCNKINSKEGKGAIYSIDSKYAALHIPRWSTGLSELDEIIGGGMPEGRVVEIYGPEGSGKTTLLYHLCSRHSLCLDLPVEGTFDVERAKIFGNRKNQMLIYRAKCGEDAFNKMIQFAQNGIPLIAVDSVPSLIPRDDIEKVMSSARKDSIEEKRIGGTARLIEKYLPTLEDIIDATGTTLLFTNQVRDKMDALLFGEKTDTPGGRRLKHSGSLRIACARRAWIKIPNKNPANVAKEETVGFIMKCKVVKSKICNPLGECELACFFDRGFVSFDDLQDIRKEIMKQRSEQFGKRAIKEEWEDSEDG